MKNNVEPKNKILLIVDDEAEIGMLLVNLLKKHFKSTIYRSSLLDGIQAAREFCPDVVLLDNNLPDGSGIDNISNFKEISPTLAVVIISAMEHMKEKAIANGAQLFIEKPFSTRKLLEMVHSID